MADNNSIGEIDVIISGDFSDLQDAINSAQGIAAQGASDIQDAFDKPDLADVMVTALQNVGDAATEVATQVGDVGTSIGTLSTALASTGDDADVFADSFFSAGDAMSGAGDAAAAAGGDLGDLGEAAGGASSDIEGVGESAHEAEGGLAAMAEQLAAVGEALVITEGLKELGQEALNAYGTVQSVTIGLTALTGSAEQANEVIEQVKQLAATEPFAFPEIAPTVQKMVALGISTEQIPVVMQAAADASAATGNSFQQVANSIDRMTLSGTAGSRQLVQLGVSAQQMGAIMGVSATEFTAAFKALDQSQRLDVLTQAMSKFAGTAIAEAQGISGQWQIFQNQFEEVMVGVGQAIAPVISDILSFGKAVLSGVQSALDAFNELPTPVKDVVVALGLMAGAVVPVTAGLAAIGIGLAGLNSLIPEATALWGTLTGVEVAEGAAATGNAVAHTTAAAAVTAANVEIAASSEAAAVGLGSEAAAAELAETQLNLFATEGAFVAGEQLTLFGAEAAESTTAVASLSAGATLGGYAFIALGAAVEGVALTHVASDIKDLDAAIAAAITPTDGLKSSMDGLATSSNTLETAWGHVKDTFSGTSWTVWVSGLVGVDKGIQGLTQDVEILSNKWPGMTAAIDANLASFNKYTAGVAAGAIATTNATATVSQGIQKVVDETNKQNTAVQQASAVYNTLKAALTDASGALKSVAQLQDGTIVTTQTLAAAHKTLAAAITAATDATKSHTTATQADKDSLANVEKEAQAVTNAYQVALATYNKIQAAQDGTATSANALAIATKNLNAAAAAYGQSAGQEVAPTNAVAAGMAAIATKVAATGSALTTAIGVYNGFRTALMNGEDVQAQYNISLNDLVKAFQAANPAMVTQKQTTEDWTTAAVNAAAAAGGWGTTYDGMVTIVRNGQTTVQQAPKDFSAIGTAADGAKGPVQNFGTTHAGMVSTVSGGHGAMSQAATDLQNFGIRAINADTPVGVLGQTQGKLISIIQGGQNAVDLDAASLAKIGANAQTGVQPLTDLASRTQALIDQAKSAGTNALDTYAQTLSNVGKAAGDDGTPLQDLGVAIGTIGVTIQDTSGARTSFIQDIQNIGNSTQHTDTEISDYAGDLLDIIYPQQNTVDFDTSLIHLSGSTVTATNSTITYNGVATTLDALLKSIATDANNAATGMQALANATTDAANAGTALSNSGSGSGGKNAGGYLSYNDPMTPEGQAAMQLLSAQAGPFAMGQTSDWNAIGSYNPASPHPFSAEAVKGGANVPLPPVYGAGSGVAGSPTVLVSNDGGSTWTDAGYGDYPSGTGVSVNTGGNPLDNLETQIQNAVLSTGASVTSISDAGAVITASTTAMAQAATAYQNAIINGTATELTPAQLAYGAPQTEGTSVTAAATTLGQLSSGELEILAANPSLLALSQATGQSISQLLAQQGSANAPGTEGASVGTLTQSSIGGSNLSSGELEAGGSSASLQALAVATGKTVSQLLLEQAPTNAEGTYGTAQGGSALGAGLNQGNTLTDAQIATLQQQLSANPLLANGGAGQDQVSAQLAAAQQTAQALSALASPTSAQTAALSVANQIVTALQTELAPFLTGYQANYTPSTLTQQQLSALLNAPGVGSGAPLPSATPQVINLNLNMAGAHVYGLQGAAQMGTSLVNTLRSTPSIKFFG